LSSIDHSLEYFLGVTEGFKKTIARIKEKPNAQLLAQPDLGKYWHIALTELSQPQPNWKNIVMVIRGHSFADKILKLNTVKLIQQYHFEKFDDEVKQLLLETKQEVEQGIQQPF